MTLFGRMQAEDGLGQPVLPRSRKARALLAILALSPNHAVLRSQATALLWSLRDKEQGRASLRQAVHELQQALAVAAPGLLHAERDQLGLAHGCFWVDAHAFHAASPCQSELLELLRRPLLEDMQGLDPAFDFWLNERSSQLGKIARTIGEGILARQQTPGTILQAAEQLLRLDRTHEGAWRAVIGACVERGDHGGATVAYEKYCSALAQQGHRTPSPEIEALLKGLRTPAFSIASSAKPNGGGQATLATDALGRGVRVGISPPRRVDGGAADGLALALAEEITTALAQFRWITCVANVQVPQASAADAAAAAGLRRHELDFLLESTLQRAGDRVRINARLTDTRTGGHVIWARRFDRSTGDIFALQDEIAAETVAQIDTTLLLWAGERARSRQSMRPDAVDLMLGAIPSIYRLERAGFHDAGALLEASLKIDPDSATAHAWLAYWHLFLVGQGWAPDAAAATHRAAELAERAVRLDAGDARALTLAGHVRGFLSKRPREASAMHDRALALNPNLALAWCFSGLTHSYLGNHAEAIRRIHHAHRLAPHDPHGFFFDTAQIMPNLLQRDYEAAIGIGRRAIAMNPGFSSSFKGQLAALGQLGRSEEAAEVRARLLALEPEFCVRDATVRSPMVRQEDIALYSEGLRRAGLPE